MQSCKQHHHTILLVLVCHHQTKLNFYACCFSSTFLEQTFLLSSPHIFLGNGFQWATLLYCSCVYSARFLLLPSFHVVDMLASSFISKAKFNRFFRIMKNCIKKVLYHWEAISHSWDLKTWKIQLIYVAVCTS